MPTRSGWSAGIHVFDAPRNIVEPPPAEPAFSYLASAGYCQIVIKQAQTALQRLRDTDFSDIFEDGPHSPLVESFLKMLDTNQRGALQEIARTPVKRLLELGIVTPSNAPLDTEFLAWGDD